MLPMTVLRRFQYVKAQTKAKVLGRISRSARVGRLNDDAVDRLSEQGIRTDDSTTTHRSTLKS